MPESPTYWKDDLFITDGLAWALDEDLETVCLGNASIVLAALASEEIPEEITGRRKRILLEMIEEKTIGGIDTSPSGPSVRRGRRLQPTARKQGSTFRATQAQEPALHSA